MVELVEIALCRWRVKRTPQNFARSEHPRPFVISGRHAAGRAGRRPNLREQERLSGGRREALGLIEVGNEKFAPKARASAGPAQEARRHQAIQKAMEQVRSE